MNSIYILGAIVIISIGNVVLSFIGSNTMLLPKTYVSLILLIIYLETNHSNCATLITTKNEVPFVKSALFSGAGVLILGLFSVKWLSLGILGLILAQGLVQLLYNNWKWPKVVFNDMKTNYFEIIKIGFAEWKNHLFEMKV